jgi:hypothetical protein
MVGKDPRGRPGRLLPMRWNLARKRDYRRPSHIIEICSGTWLYKTSKIRIIRTSGTSAMAKLTVYEGRGRGRRPGDYSAILTCRGMLSVMHEQAPHEFHHRVLSRSFDRRLTRDIGANFSSRRRPRGCKGESETAGRARREVLLSMRVKRLFNCHCEMVPAVAICNK